MKNNFNDNYNYYSDIVTQVVKFIFSILNVPPPISIIPIVGSPMVFNVPFKQLAAIQANPASSDPGITAAQSVGSVNKKPESVSKIKKANALSNVVVKLQIEENKLKAVSNTVWVCWKAMI